MYVDELMRRGEEGGLPGPIKGFLAELNRFSSDMTEIELKPRFHLLPVLAVVLGFYACAHRGQLAGRQAVQAEFDAGKFPVTAASFMETQKLAGNLFSSDYWGGYLIYRFYPERKVFVDGRSDFYGDAFLKQYLEVLTLRWNWETVLTDYDVDHVLIRADAALASTLKESSRWRPSYDDGFAILVSRKK